MPSGLAVWYYRARTQDGRRTTAWSTDIETKYNSKTEKWSNLLKAREHYRKLQTNGMLTKPPSWGLKKKGLTVIKNPLTFADLATGFWDWDGEYVQTRLRFSDPKEPAVSRRYVGDCDHVVALHLLPAVRHRILAEFTPQEIEAWALRKRDGGLSGKRVNNLVPCPRVMLCEAHRAGLLPCDPVQKDPVGDLGSATKHRGRLTREEVRALFADEAIEAAWGGHTLYRSVIFVAAATGMRQGEILAVRDTDIHDGFIFLKPHTRWLHSTGGVSYRPQP